MDAENLDKTLSILWRANDVADVLGTVWHGGEDASISGVSIDSRTVSAGDLFFAIKGDRFDGHDFVSGALQQGATAAVVAQEKLSELEISSGRLLVVDDVLRAMETLGCAARERLRKNDQAKIIAVTGSVGKTGTKEALRMAFGACGITHASLASFNNHWGVPLTLCRTPSDVDFGVYEIGMNHPGEIKPLVDMVRPDIAIITTVEPVHLEFFESEREIAQAKAEIFSGLEPDGYAVLNRDNRHFSFLSKLAEEQKMNVVSFGDDEKADIRLVRIELHEERSEVWINLMGQSYHYSIGAPGRHIVQNSLAVAAALHLAGADVACGLRALADIRAPKGRGARQRLKIDEGYLTLLDESYNANPASMRAALRLMGATQPGKKGRRIAVIGDMLELGERSDELHAGLLNAVQEAGTDLIFLCGPHMKTLYDALPATITAKYADQSEGFAESLVREVAPGDVIMVKGSLGSRMGLLVSLLTQHYPHTT